MWYGLFSHSRSHVKYGLLFRELLCKSLEDRRIDMITVTSAEGMTDEREEELPFLFPDKTIERCHAFKNKKVYSWLTDQKS